MLRVNPESRPETIWHRARPCHIGRMDGESFYGLTPETILTSVEEAGLPVTGRCLQRNSLENRVYEVEIDTESENRSERFRIAKFYRPGRWSAEQILEEHAFLADLRAEEIPCAAPITLPEGSTLGRAGDIFFALFERVGGRQLDEYGSSEREQLGRLLARVHNVGSRSPAKARLRLNEDTYGLAPLTYLLETDSIPAHMSKRYAQLVRTICEHTAELRGTLMQASEFMPALEEIRLHGDCHGGNILWSSEGPFLIDFDDMVMGPPVQDLWLLAADPEDLEPIVSGYEQMRDFDRRSLRLVEHLRALRYIHFSAWIARRWSDPAFPGAFPGFGTEQYWATQIADLVEQLERIETPPPSIYD